MRKLLVFFLIIIIVPIALVGVKNYYVNKNNYVASIPTINPLQFKSCLPKNVEPSSPFVYNGTQVKETLGQKLQEIGAHCSSWNVLIDKTTKKVYIELPLFCGGNVPGDYRDRIAQENQNIQNLRKTATVLVLPCKPTLY